MRVGTVVCGAALVAAGGYVLVTHTLAAEFGLGVALCVVGSGVALLCLLPRDVHRRGLLAAASIGFALLLSEAGLRLFSPWGQSTIYEIDPRLLHCCIPGSSKIYQRLPENGGEAIRVEINERGFRGPPLAARQRGLRVAVFGDSCVAAEFSAHEDTFVSRLGIHLALQTGEAVETVNAGVVGYGPDQSLRRMERDLAALDADLAVVVLFADNDFGDLLRNRLYRVGADGALEDNGARIPDALREEFQFASVRSALVRMLWRPPTLVRGAARGDAVRDLPPGEARVQDYLAWSLQTYRSAVLERDPQVSTLLADYYDADVSLLPRSESARYKVRLMELVMLAMQRLCARLDVPLVFVLLPSPLDMSDASYHGTVNLERFPEYVPTALCDRLREIAQRHGLRCVDLFPVFWQGGRDRLYFRCDNGHWNDAGQDLAARTVAASVAR